MKPLLVFLAIFALPTIFASSQEWGETSHRSRLIRTEEFKWINTFDPDQLVAIRRTFQFPRQISDERNMPPIAAIFVTHHGCGWGGWAELAWGGPRNRFVGLEFESAPGECIEATIEIWA